MSLHTPTFWSGFTEQKITMNHTRHHVLVRFHSTRAFVFLGHCPEVQEVDLSHSLSLTDVSALSLCGNLKTLNVSYGMVTDVPLLGSLCQFADAGSVPQQQRADPRLVPGPGLLLPADGPTDGRLGFGPVLPSTDGRSGPLRPAEGGGRGCRHGGSLSRIRLVRMRSAYGETIKQHKPALMPSLDPSHNNRSACQGALLPFELYKALQGSGRCTRFGQHCLFIRTGLTVA